jgi:predicted glycosyltransferase
VKGPIGYYVHHHGDGHRQRALALAAAAQSGRMVLFGTGLAGRTGNVATVDLPDDRMMDTDAFDGVDGTTSRPLACHYAPLDHEGVRKRMGLIARWIMDNRPAIMVVDVSVEIAMLARLCATRVAFVRLSGHRDDPAHMEAYRAASLLVAPFSQTLDDMTLPAWVREKTVYCPGVTIHGSASSQPVSGRVLVVGGKGGAPQDGTLIAAAASATPDRQWRVIGPATPPRHCPENLAFVGWTNDPLREIAASEIVVGAAGDGLVNAVIAIGRPFICIPEPRPFSEQVQKARSLGEARAAVVVEAWPQVWEWARLLEQAQNLDLTRLVALGDPNGAVNMLAALNRNLSDQK